MITKQYILNFRKILLDNNITVGELEMTLGNYSEKGDLIEYALPTITTDLCEIGAYDGIVYFTVIIYSNSYNQKLFELIKDWGNIKIYGFKNFLDNLYPKDNFDYKKFEDKIKEDEYLQIQFNFNDMKLGKLYEEYLKVVDIFKESRVRVVNQLEVDLIKN